MLCALLLHPARVLAEEWFDAYERGLEALRQRQGARAVQLFERAIVLRAEPGANLITNGTNRLETYHPYLQLARAYLLAGDLNKAREALRRSAARDKEPDEERDRIVALVGEAEAARAVTMPPASPAASPAGVAEAPSPQAEVPPTTSPAASPAVPGPSPAAGPTLSATSAAAREPPVVILGGAPSIPETVPPGSPSGTLNLESDPAEATVFVEGRFMGTTPLRLALVPGEHPVSLRKDGMADLDFVVSIEAGKTHDERRVLSPASASSAPAVKPSAVASLVVYTQPGGAEVYLDDEPLGATDPASGRLVKNGVTAGKHRLRFSRPGNDDLVRSLTVVDAGPTTVTVVLPSAIPRRLPAVLGALVALGLLAAVGLVVWRRRRRVPPTEAGTREPVTLPRRAAETVTVGRESVGGVIPADRDEPGDLETRAIPVPTKVSPGEDRFGDYRLIEQLGRGGMAAVFKAEREGEACALKRPLGAFLDDPEFLLRFLREADIGRTLHHPNIIRIFERGEVDGVPYFTMELVGGETLQAHLRRNGAMSPRTAAHVIAQVAEALDYAHLKGVIHRDLKPSNIMLLEDGTVKVMDYGIARSRRFEGLTVTGSFLGTPEYAAPETAEGGQTDARSDLYALGVVFYEILTGAKPFVADTPFATMRKHCTEPPAPPSALSADIPRELEEIVLRLLQKNPDQRYANAEELLMELRGFLNKAA
jgi:serine/threonine-protein kinase